MIEYCVVSILSYLIKKTLQCHKLYHLFKLLFIYNKIIRPRTYFSYSSGIFVCFFCHWTKRYFNQPKTHLVLHWCGFTMKKQLEYQQVFHQFLIV